MSSFDAIVTQDIPANRLLSMTGGNGAPHISITAPGGNPDFVSTGELKANQTVVVSMKDNPIWKVEAGEDLKAGQHVEVGADGVIVASDGEGIGFVSDEVSAGGLAKLVRAGKVGPQGPKGNPGPKGDPGEVTKAELDDAVANLQAQIDELKGGA
jgi:hypothetical protein